MKNVVLQVRVDEEFASIVKAEAEKERRKVSEFVRMAIESYMISKVPQEAFKSDAPIGPCVAESPKPHSGHDPQSDDPRRTSLNTVAEVEKVFKPDPRLSKDYQTRGRGGKKARGK